MIVTSEYIFINPKLKEITNIIKNTERNHYEKYGQDKIKIQALCYVEFIDRWTKKIKNVTIGNYYIIYRINRRICASNKRYSVNKVNKLMITIEAEIKKYVINTYLKNEDSNGLETFLSKYS